MFTGLERKQRRNGPLDPVAISLSALPSYVDTKEKPTRVAALVRQVCEAADQRGQIRSVRKLVGLLKGASGVKSDADKQLVLDMASALLRGSTAVCEKAGGHAWCALEFKRTSVDLFRQLPAIGSSAFETAQSLLSFLTESLSKEIEGDEKQREHERRMHAELSLDVLLSSDILKSSSVEKEQEKKMIGTMLEACAYDISIASALLYSTREDITASDLALPTEACDRLLQAALRLMQQYPDASQELLQAALNPRAEDSDPSCFGSFLEQLLVVASSPHGDLRCVSAAGLTAGIIVDRALRAIGAKEKQEVLEVVLNDGDIPCCLDVMLKDHSKWQTLASRSFASTLAAIPTLGRLALTRGLVIGIEPDVLLSCGGKNWLLLSCLPGSLAQCSSTTTPPLRLLAVRCVEEQMKVVLSAVTPSDNKEKAGKEGIVRSRLGLDHDSFFDDILSDVMRMLWSNWDYHFDAVVASVITSCEVILQIQKVIGEASRNAEEAEASHVFFFDVARDVLSRDFKQKSTLSALNVLTPFVSAQSLLQLDTTLLTKLLKALSGGAARHKAGQLLRTLLLSLKSTMTLKEFEAEMEVWLTQMADLMASADREAQAGFVIYGLPQLVEHVQSAYFDLLFRLLAKQIPASGQFEPTASATSGVLSMLKIIRGNLNIPLEDVGGELAKKGGAVAELPSTTVRDVVHAALLSSAHENLRFSALEVLATTKSPTAPIDEYEMDLVRQYFTYALLERTGTKGKQEVTALLMRLLYRQMLSVRTEFLALEKQIAKIRRSEDEESAKEAAIAALGGRRNRPALEKTLKTVEWLSNLMGAWLYPGSPTAKSHVSAYMYSTLLLDVWRVGRREIALDATARKGREEDVHFTAFLPEDISPAKDIAVTSRANELSLFFCLWDSYDQSRADAFQALCSCPMPLTFIQTKDEVALIYATALAMANASLARECDVGSLLLRLLGRAVEHDSSLLGVITPNAAGKTLEGPGVRLFFFEHIVSLLKGQVDEAKKDWAAVARTSPMHGLLLALRYLIGDAELKQLPSQLQNGWKAVIVTLLGCISDVIDLALRVVGDVAPEGYSTDSYFQLGYGDCCSINREGENAALGTAIMQCSWHSVKGCSLLMATLISECHLPDPSGKEELLSVSQVKDMTSSILRVLLSTKHKGALEKTYVAAESICKSLLSSKNADLHAIPLQWVEELFVHVDNPVSVVTRRSAGLPMAFCAVLHAEVFLHRRGTHPVLKRVFGSLIERIQSMNGRDLSDQELLTATHCYNVMLAILKDHVLGSSIDEWLPTALVLTVSGLSCAQWAIRNSSTMCFSALMHRFVGPEHRHDDKKRSGTQRNMSFAQFFSRVPELNSFIYQQLLRAAEGVKAGETDSDEATAMHTSMYCLLLLLSRLSAAETSKNLGVISLQPPTAFVDALRALGGHPDYRIRVMAARALVPLVSGDQVITHAIDQLQEIPGNNGDGNHTVCHVKDHNRVHGALLQVFHLFRAHGLAASAARFNQESLTSKLADTLFKRLYLLQSECPTVAAAFADVVLIFLAFPSASAYPELLLETTKLMRNVLVSMPNAQVGMLATFRKTVAGHCIGAALNAPEAYEEWTGETATALAIALTVDDGYEVREVCLEKLIAFLRFSRSIPTQQLAKFSKKEQLKAQRDQNDGLDRRQLQLHLLECLGTESMASVNKLLLECLLVLNLDLPTACIADGSLWTTTAALHESRSSCVMRESAVKFMGLVIANTLRHLRKVGTGFAPLLPMLTAWVEALEQHSLTSGAMDERKAALESVIASGLLETTAEAVTESADLENSLVKVWLVMARFIVDDEEDVRQRSTEYLAGIQDLCIAQKRRFPSRWTHVLGMSSSQTQECLYLFVAKRFHEAAALFDILSASVITEPAFVNLPDCKDEDGCYFPAELDNMWEEPLLEQQLRAHALLSLVTERPELRETGEWKKAKHALIDNFTALAKLLEDARSSHLVQLSANGDLFSFAYRTALALAVLIKAGHGLSPDEKKTVDAGAAMLSDLPILHPMLRHCVSFLTGRQESRLGQLGLLFAASPSIEI